MNKDKNSEKSAAGGSLKRIRAAKDLGQVEGHLSSDNLAGLIEIIRHEKLGPLVHEKYMEDRRSSVRFEIASQVTTEKKVLEKLATDPNQLVRTKAKERLLEISLTQKSTT